MKLTTAAPRGAARVRGRAVWTVDRRIPGWFMWRLRLRKCLILTNQEVLQILAAV